jgi:ribosome-binding factor A
MANVAHQRKEKACLQAVSQIVTEEITNSNISLTTVTMVKLSGDLSHLKIYVSFERNKARSLENLQNASGFVRSQLASRLPYRKVPQLHFIIDDSFEKGNKIEAILKKIRDQKKINK